MNDKIDRMFIGAIRTNKAPIRFELEGGASYTIPCPDKQLGYELSLAIQNYKRRKETKE